MKIWKFGKRVSRNRSLQAARRQKQQSRFLRFEPLEDRRMLTAEPGCDVTVNDTGSGDHTTINAGIAAADAGKTVCVADGTYEENVVINKDITLRGAQAGMDARDRDAAESHVIGSIHVTSDVDTVAIDGFEVTVTVGGPWSNTALIVDAQNATIANNIVRGVSTTGPFTRSGMIDLNGVVNAEIAQNDLQLHFHAPGQQNGILVGLTASADEVEIADNRIANAAGGGIGIMNLSDADVDITISGNELADNADGIWLAGPGFGQVSIGTYQLTGNTFANNAVQVRDLAEGFDLEAALDDNTFDRAVTVRGSAIKVPTIFSSIQDGINAADAGDTVQVEAGSYNEDVLVNKSLTLRGANAGISASVDAGVRDSEATVDGGFRLHANDVTIDGFTILNGVGPIGIGQTTAVFFAANTTGHTIANNFITGNGEGRGILSTFNGGNDHLIIRGNDIGHWTTGIFNQGNTNVEITCNSIHDNVAGVGNDFVDDVRIKHNDFKDNDEAVGAFDSTGIVVNNNDLDGNDMGVNNYGGDDVDARLNWWGTTDADEIADLVSGDVNFTPWLLDSVFSGNNLFYSDNGVSLMVNQATGEYTFVDDNGVVYSGTGARIQNGVLKIHDQSSNGKIDVMGNADGTISVSLKGKGQPRTFSLDFDESELGIC